MKTEKSTFCNSLIIDTKIVIKYGPNQVWVFYQKRWINHLRNQSTGHLNCPWATIGKTYLTQLQQVLPVHAWHQKCIHETVTSKIVKLFQKIEIFKISNCARSYKYTDIYPNSKWLPTLKCYLFWPVYVRDITRMFFKIGLTFTWKCKLRIPIRW